MARLLVKIAFGLLLAYLPFAFVAHWLIWDMAGDYCHEGYWACRRQVIPSVALFVILPFGCWLTLLWGLWKLHEPRKGRR